MASNDQYGTQGLARFCSRCGTELQPEQAFCPSCGAPHGVAPLPAAAPSLPAPYRSKATWGWIVGGCFIAAAIIASFFIMTRGGEGEPGTAGTNVSSPPAQAVEAKLPEIVPYVVQPDRRESRLGPFDEVAATSVKESIRKLGFSLVGFEPYVYPLLGTQGETLLVLNFDLQPGSMLEKFSASGTTTDPVFKAIANNMVLKEVGVTRVAVNVKVPSASKPDVFLYTMTMPFETLSKIANGQMTQEAAQAQTLYQVRVVRTQSP